MNNLDFNTAKKGDIITIPDFIKPEPSERFRIGPMILEYIGDNTAVIISNAFMEGETL